MNVIANYLNMQQQCFKCHQCQRYGTYECTYRTVFQTEMSNRQTHFQMKKSVNKWVLNTSNVINNWLYANMQINMQYIVSSSPEHELQMTR